MHETLGRSEVLTILRHAGDHPWRLQEVGLMALRLDGRRDHRLHVWDPTRLEDEPPVHDHPYDFTSTVVAGELTDTTYVEDAGGDEFVRFRYAPPAEDARRPDAVRLSATPVTHAAGAAYGHAAADLHDSRQLPGTVTVIRCAFLERPELTVCVRDERSWCSGRSRAATGDEVRAFAAAALQWF